MCTGVRFSDLNGNFYFGRNLDWFFDFGQSVVIAPRQFTFTSPFQGTQTLKHGAVIGMAIIEDNIPLYFDCANESGLAVAGLVFTDYTKYEPAPVEGKTNIAAYEFPLWLVANFATVAEVKTALKNVAIVARRVNDKYPVSDLHWLIGDKESSIVVEYTERGLEVFDDPVDVLTNQPGFAWHQENLRSYLNVYNTFSEKVNWGAAELTPYGVGGDMRGLPGDYYSPSRFVRVAFANSHYPAQSTESANIARLFHTLSATAMILGSAAGTDGQFEYTTYTGGYSSLTKTYYFNTYEKLNLSAVCMDNYDLDTAALLEFKIKPATLQ